MTNDARNANSASAEPPLDRHIREALKNFDQLPDAAHVRVAVVASLLDCSVGTVWRRVRQRALPAPYKLGPKHTGWRVGELRRALQNFAA